MKKFFNKEDFVSQYKRIKGVGFKNNTELANILGFKSPNSITEIVSGRQNISDSAYSKFVDAFGDLIESNELPKKQNRTGVPFYDVDVTATIAESYLDSTENPEYYVDFPPFNDCDAYTRIYGDSMYPKYQSGEIIAIKKLNNFDIMRWGETHLIITDGHYDNLRTIKNIHPCPKDDDCIIIRASNPKFEGDNKILKKHILGLFLVKGKASVHHM